MELPLTIRLDGIYTFNLEIPYYNWFYPLQHSEDTIHQLVNNEISLSEVKGVYVHIPFCSSLCSFCPYIRTHIHDKELRNKYVSYLISEIKSYKRDAKPKLDCLFFGGGSPSLLSPDNFADIMEAILGVFKLSSNCEITLEANAMSLNKSLCAAFNAYNVSKIRIGVQSFNQKSRQLYQLKATINDIVRSTELVHKHDMLVSFDLLFGHHGQTLDSFLKDIDLAHNLNPDTIEIYPINLLSAPDRYWNAVSSMGVRRLRARDRIYFFKAARDRLIELGYHQWSGHGFARSANFDLLYHRCVYGTLGGILSFGPGAISFESGAFLKQ
jgi:coproporphyrinogen III oxidase-like Fe-S oxidoreductase